MGPNSRLTALLLCLGAPTLSAAGEEKKTLPAAPSAGVAVSYFKEIRPILKRRCQGCHQPAKGDGKLSVTTYEALKKGGRHGAGFEPGKPDDSWVLKFLDGEEKPRMPKGQPPLPDAEIELFRRWIRAGAADDTPASAREAPRAPERYPLPSVISALAYSHDGALLAVSGCQEVLLHRVDAIEDDPTGGTRPWKRLQGLSQRIEGLAFSPDGALLAVAGGSPADLGEVQLWSIPEGKLLRSAPVSYDSVLSSAFSLDGSTLAVGCADNSARLLRVSDLGQTLRVDHHQDWVFGAMFSVDGKNLVTVSRDRAMKLTEVSTGSFIDNVTSITPGVLGGGLQCLARQPKADGFATGGEDGIPRLYKIVRTSARFIGDDNNLLRAFEKLPGFITAVAFSPDGGRLLVGATQGEGRIYEVADGKRVATLDAGGAPIFSVAYRPDAKTVALGGKDGSVRLFDVSGKLLRRFIPAPLAERSGQVARSF